MDNENSLAKLYLRNKAKILSQVLNKKMGFLKPNHITTFGIILNASALMNLLNYEFIIFILLFFMAYFCDILDGEYAREFNMETEIGKKYDKIADWLKLISTYIVFSTLYKNKITQPITIIIILVLIMCNIHFIVRYNLRKIDKSKSNSLIDISKFDDKCIEMWARCLNFLDKKQLDYISIFTRYFDETMVILFIICMMVYIHYK